MYIPYLANEVLTQDPSINLQGILIGNGAMWLNWKWRGMMGDRFWISHYYYGPEISQLISRCKYDDSDEKNPSCARGMNLAEKVNFHNYLRLSIRSTLTSQQVFAILMEILYLLNKCKTEANSTELHSMFITIQDLQMSREDLVHHVLMISELLNILTFQR